MANERWASDANFPAGSDPWSGEPTKVAPDAGEIAAGHTPGVIVPAETENWWKNRTDARLEALEGTETLVLAIDSAYFDDAVVLHDVANEQLIFQTTGYAALGIALPVGRRISEIRVRVKDGGAGQKLVVELRSSVDGTSTQVATEDSDESGAASTVTLAGLAVDIEEGTNFTILVSPDSDTANDKYFYAACVDHIPTP